jgi:hypothetical protein
MLDLESGATKRDGGQSYRLDKATQLYSATHNRCMLHGSKKSESMRVPRGKRQFGYKLTYSYNINNRFRVTVLNLRASIVVPASSLLAARLHFIGPSPSLLFSSIHLDAAAAAD